LGKLIIITAPSGAGKTTIVKELLKRIPRLSFSVSATTRAKREMETDGLDYYFISEDDFRNRIKNGDFAEWEEVYKGRFYGTLKSEIERKWGEGKAVLFDIDVLGAKNLQKVYPSESLSIFIKPPSKEVLFKRLEDRQTESADSLQMRKQRAEQELKMEPEFDKVVLNDKLELAISEAEQLIHAFLSSES
jgi:guanylate kinase